jgi:hypothetical protein
MSDNLPDAPLSAAATKRIDSLIFRYAIWAGVTLLGLNIVAGATAIWAFWSSAYTTARQEYRDSLAVLQKQWEAEKTLLTAKMTSELDQSVNAKFNNQDVRRRLDQITMDAGRLEAESKAAADRATSAAKGAEATSEKAGQSAKVAIEKSTASVNTCNAAQIKADEALKTAEATSKELKERLKTIQTSDVELAKSISLMIELMKDEKNQPLSKLDARISGVDAKISSLTVRLEAATASDTPSAVRTIHYLAAADVVPLWAPGKEPTNDGILRINPDPAVSSFEIDLSNNSRVPGTARGVILKILITRRGEQRGKNEGAASLLFADHTGQFPELVPHHGNGVTNDLAEWIGSTVIVPFSPGRKILCKKNNDREVHSYGTLLGYYD